MTPQSLQNQLAPQSICFGCGPANPNGLKIQSFPQGQELVAHWTPATEHQAFLGVVNGGIIGALLDCHSNWTAAWFLMNRDQTQTLPCTVTAEFSVKLLRPTPLAELELRASVKTAENGKVTVHATLSAQGKVCATCEGIFVAVKPGHPAFHRW